MSLNIKYEKLPWKFTLQIEFKRQILATAVKIQKELER